MTDVRTTPSPGAGRHAQHGAGRTTLPVHPRHSLVRGVRTVDVTLDPRGFWGSRQQVNADATLSHCLTWMEDLGWLENFDRVARGEITGERPGWQFSDSEVYKLLEAMAWQLGRAPDAALQEQYDTLVRRIAAAQDPDGYLGTAFGHPGLPARYSDLSMGHELYNLGHLVQAGIAAQRSLGPSQLLMDVARRAADHVCAVFGPEAEGICGHPEIEVALAELGRELDDERYLHQAELFIDRRGRGSLPVRTLLGADYFQDDVPVRAAESLRGHAVRALYLSAGAVDVAVDSGDDELLAVLIGQWRRTVERRTFITGGMGSRHQDEGFGEDWELPPDRAYCETCAGIAAVMFSWRLYLATGGVEYVDFIERVLYNVVATSPSSDGRSFFYSNPLQQRVPGEVAQDRVNTRAEGSTRAPWFDVSCCPTNVARTFASLGAYIAATDRDGLAILQYAPGTIESEHLTVEVATAYPADGRVEVTVVQAAAEPVTLTLRVPSWAQGATIGIGEDPVAPAQPGWARVTRVWSAGERLTLTLPTAPRFSWPHPRIDAVRGTVAVERGPLVLALESHEVPDDRRIEDLRLDATAPPHADGDGAAVQVRFLENGPAGGPAPAVSSDPYPRATGPARQLSLIPYHRWAERGPSTMRVFLPIDPSHD